MKRKRRVLLITVSLLLTVGVVPAWRVWRQAKRAYATHHLIAAIKDCNVELVRAYLDDGADPNVRTTSEAPLSFWQALKSVLLHRRSPAADMDDVEPHYPALVFALMPREGDTDPLAPAEKQRRADIACLLMTHGAKVKNVPDKEADIEEFKYTPLSQAVGYQMPQVVRQLLERGADPNPFAINGYTPLIRAVGQNNTDIVEQLLARGANTDARCGHHDTTALMRALFAGRKANVQMLLRYGANVNSEDDYGNTALDYARQDQQNDYVRMFQQAGARYERTETAALFHAIRRNDVKTVRALLKDSSRRRLVEKGTADQSTALRVAVEMGYSHSAQYAGAPPRNNTALVRLLIDRFKDSDYQYGADVVAALKMAQCHGSREVCRLLETANKAALH